MNFISLILEMNKYIYETGWFKWINRWTYLNYGKLVQNRQKLKWNQGENWLYFDDYELC